MALIECKRCGKRISDKAEQCVHCGYRITITCPECRNMAYKGESICPKCGFPFERMEKQKEINGSSDDSGYNGIVPFFGVFLLAVILALLAAESCTREYLTAQKQLDDGEYLSALDTLSNCTKTSEKALYKEAWYEMCTLSAYNVLQDSIDNPDAIKIHDVELYSFEAEDELVTDHGRNVDSSKIYPYLIIHYGWEDRDSETGLQYASLLFDGTSGSYVYHGNACSLDVDKLEDDTEEYNCLVAATEMNRVKDDAEKCGHIDLERLNKMITSGEYSRYRELEAPASIEEQLGDS